MPYGDDMTNIDTGTDQLLAVLDDGVLTITLSRPERRNALTTEMLQAFATTIEFGEDSDEVGCVVVTGAGGAFCAGGDVKAMASEGGVGGGTRGTLTGRTTRQRQSQRSICARLHRMPKPTIAALPGAAAGAGLGIALACDLRVASSKAIMVTAFATVALASDYGTGWFLNKLVGPSKARELLFLSERVTMDEALRLGLVNRVVEADDLSAATTDWARRLAHGPRLTLEFMKENLNRADHVSLEDYMDTEVFLHNYSGTTADHHEASQAFVEKRPPNFG